MSKTLKQILDDFDDHFFSIDCSGGICGRDNKITIDNEYSQLGAIRKFIEQEITELLNSLVPEESNEHDGFDVKAIYKNKCREELQDKINNIL